jgi:hypothetical protein
MEMNLQLLLRVLEIISELRVLHGGDHVYEEGNLGVEGDAWTCMHDRPVQFSVCIYSN